MHQSLLLFQHPIHGLLVHTLFRLASQECPYDRNCSRGEMTEGL